MLRNSPGRITNKNVAIIIVLFICASLAVFVFYKPQTDVKESNLDDNSLTAVRSRSGLIFVDKNGILRIPSRNVLQQLSLNQLEELFHRYLENIQVHCKSQMRMGSVVDGGYHVCMDPSVSPSNDCLAYSFGIRRDFSFDDQLSKWLGCEVHCFDPGDGQKEHNRSAKISFHPIGIGGKDEMANRTAGQKWTIKTLRTIQKDLGHTQRRLEVVKIDTEGAEWGALPQMLEDGILSQVKQLIMEIHSFIGNGPFKTSHRTKEKYIEDLGLFRKLFDQGFRLFFFRSYTYSNCLYQSEDGTPRTGCHEIHFMKVE